MFKPSSSPIWASFASVGSTINSYRESNAIGWLTVTSNGRWAAVKWHDCVAFVGDV